MDISASIRMGLAKRNMTMEDLAGVCGVRRETVSSWCNGKTKPDFDLTRMISEHAFGVQMSEFIKWGE